MIDRLRELDSAATPGPWRTYHDGLTLDGEERQLVSEVADDTDYGAVAKWMTPADAALIAEARNALPKLLAIAEAARMVSQWHDSIGSGPIEVLNAELGGLKELVAALDNR
jgi:hypothetical protein